MSKKINKIYLLIICISLLIISVKLNAQVFSPGEELVYEVSYMNIKLGSIRLIYEKMDNVSGSLGYKVKAYVGSYSGIPFVDLQAVMQSWIDTSVTYSHKFLGNTKQSNDSWLYEQVIFNPYKKEIDINHWLNKKLSLSDTIKTKKRYCDGLSILYIARYFGASKSHKVFPLLVYQDTTYISFDFKGNKENIDIDAVKYKIKTVKFSGAMGGKGIYGLTGNFEGWLSDDSALIPILGKLKVYIGSVNVELISWKRNNWYPPKA